ncbi:MAG TPA: ASKHA domain-containing protein [Vicinamibacteria bacterium]|nr:ASKHA domain-containing protein [Vicinamibacteria bacterium]
MKLFVNDCEAPVTGTLFECAESVNVRVPTSCVKQGKCRECLLEIEQGEEFLSERTPEEAHLGASFRLACRTRLENDGTVRCHTMRRGSLKIVDQSEGLPSSEGPLEPREGYGIALDVGTTTVALRLFDLASGALVASQSFENPQRFGGSDIMARIHYDTHHRGRLLKRTLIGYLNHAVEALPVDPDRIVEVVVAANTTMRDLFFGLDVYSIGQKPYWSITERELRERKRDTTALGVPARKLGLHVHPKAVVYGLPLIGSHVGGDAAACLWASGLADSDGVSVVMDVGTNTEIVMGNRDRIVAASCPAGPAFEGGGVLCGMPALDGAIERVSIAEDGSLDVVVIGGGPPRGLCGSGLVDLLSELRRAGRMNAQGRFTEESEPFRVHDGIVFTEADVNELAQAKGANVAGLAIVADVYGIRLEEIDKLYLAGGFARHLDLDAARRIGFLPELPNEKFVRVGNAALDGASMLLRSPSRRRQLEHVVMRVEHIELETHPRFFDYFVEGCQFQPVGSEVYR